MNYSVEKKSTNKGTSKIDQFISEGIPVQLETFAVPHTSVNRRAFVNDSLPVRMCTHPSRNKKKEEKKKKKRH